jgi:hypothetical protein
MGERVGPLNGREGGPTEWERGWALYLVLSFWIRAKYNNNNNKFNFLSGLSPGGNV